MVAVTSRVRAPSAGTSPCLSFWKHARGSDPYASKNGYTGSYTNANRNNGNNQRRSSSRGGTGTWGHWAADTSVDNPHGPGNHVAALEYHPKEDVAVSAASGDGSFNLWGLRRSAAIVNSLAADKRRAGGEEKEAGKPEKAPSTHWACSLSVR